MLASVLLLVSSAQNQVELRPGEAFLRVLESAKIVRESDLPEVKAGIAALEKSQWSEAFRICRMLELKYGAAVLASKGAGTVMIRPADGSEAPKNIPRSEFLNELATLQLYVLNPKSALRDLPATEEHELVRMCALARSGNYQGALELVRKAKIVPVAGGWVVVEKDMAGLAEIYGQAAENGMEERVRLHEIAMAMDRGTGLLPDPRGSEIPSDFLQREANLVLAELTLKEKNLGLAKAYLGRLLKDKSAQGVFYRRMANAYLSTIK